MKLIVVEDDDWKRNQLVAFLLREMPGAEVETTRSVNSGLRKISGGADAVILDMSLPSFDGGTQSSGRPQGFGGREILAQLRLRGLKVPVILVTQYGQFEDGDKLRSLSEVDKELRSVGADNYLGSVLFTAEVTGWEEELRSLLKQVLVE